METYESSNLTLVVLSVMFTIDIEYFMSCRSVNLTLGTALDGLQGSLGTPANNNSTTLSKRPLKHIHRVYLTLFTSAVSTTW